MLNEIKRILKIMKRTFKSDLLLGNKGEVKVGNIFKEKGYEVVYNTAKTIEELKGYDLTITKDEVTYKVEVKTDLMWEQTGNIAVEFNCVTNTKADYWCYVLGDLVHYLPINKVYRLLSGDGRVVWGGDRCATQLKLVSVVDFLKVSKELKVE